MKKTQDTLTEVALVSLASFILLAIVFLAPNGGGNNSHVFFHAAISTTWSNLLDWVTVWSSVKVILLSASLFLLIDSLGTLLLTLNYRRMAGKVFILVCLPFLGLILGIYYLIKSLL